MGGSSSRESRATTTEPLDLDGLITAIAAEAGATAPTDLTPIEERTASGRREFLFAADFKHVIVTASGPQATPMTRFVGESRVGGVRVFRSVVADGATACTVRCEVLSFPARDLVVKKVKGKAPVELVKSAIKAINLVQERLDHTTAAFSVTFEQEVKDFVVIVDGLQALGLKAKQSRTAWTIEVPEPTDELRTRIFLFGRQLGAFLFLETRVPSSVTTDPLAFDIRRCSQAHDVLKILILNDRVPAAEDDPASFPVATRSGGGGGGGGGGGAGGGGGDGSFATVIHHPRGSTVESVSGSGSHPVLATQVSRAPGGTTPRSSASGGTPVATPSPELTTHVSRAPGSSTPRSSASGGTPVATPSPAPSPALTTQLAHGGAPMIRASTSGVTTTPVAAPAPAPAPAPSPEPGLTTRVAHRGAPMNGTSSPGTTAAAPAASAPEPSPDRLPALRIPDDSNGPHSIVSPAPGSRGAPVPPPALPSSSSSSSSDVSTPAWPHDRASTDPPAIATFTSDEEQAEVRVAQRKAANEATLVSLSDFVFPTLTENPIAVLKQMVQMIDARTEALSAPMELRVAGGVGNPNLFAHVRPLVLDSEGVVDRTQTIPSVTSKADSMRAAREFEMTGKPATPDGWRFTKALRLRIARGKDQLVFSGTVPHSRGTEDATGDSFPRNLAGFVGPARVGHFRHIAFPRHRFIGSAAPLIRHLPDDILRRAKRHAAVTTWTVTNEHGHPLRDCLHAFTPRTEPDADPVDDDASGWVSERLERKDAPSIDADVAALLLLQMLEAVATAHTAGVVHTALSLDNVAVNMRRDRLTGVSYRLVVESWESSLLLFESSRPSHIRVRHNRVNPPTVLAHAPRAVGAAGVDVLEYAEPPSPLSARSPSVSFESPSIVRTRSFTSEENTLETTELLRAALAGSESPSLAIASSELLAEQTGWVQERDFAEPERGERPVLLSSPAVRQALEERANLPPELQALLAASSSSSSSSSPSSAGSSATLPGATLSSVAAGWDARAAALLLLDPFLQGSSSVETLTKPPHWPVILWLVVRSLVDSDPSKRLPVREAILILRTALFGPTFQELHCTPVVLSPRTPSRPLRTVSGALSPGMRPPASGFDPVTSTGAAPNPAQTPGPSRFRPTTTTRLMESGYSLAGTPNPSGRPEMSTLLPAVARWHRKACLDTARVFDRTSPTSTPWLTEVAYQTLTSLVHMDTGLWLLGLYRASDLVARMMGPDACWYHTRISLDELKDPLFAEPGGGGGRGGGAGGAWGAGGGRGAAAGGGGALRT